MKNGTSPGPRADAITLEQRFLLRAAGSRDRTEVTEAWASFRQLVPEGKEDQPSRRLLPAVCLNLARAEGGQDIFLLHAYAQSFGASARLLAATAGALRVLNRASIPAMVLKGAALLVAHYRDLGIRPMSDADILVPEARIVDAIEALMREGWHGDRTLAWLQTEMHAGTLTHSGSTIDLHRHALYEARYAAADDALFAVSIPVEVAGVPCRAMSAEDQLVHSVVHGLRWSIAPSNIWILDAITLLRGGAIDPEAVRSRAENLGFTVPLRRGLDLVASVFGPEEALSALLAHLARSPQPMGARAEHWFRVREPAGLWGALPNLWFAHQRSERPGRIGIAGFPSFLTRAWGLGGPGQLPGALFRKAARRLRSTVR